MTSGRSASAGRPSSFPELRALLALGGRRSRVVAFHRGRPLLDEQVRTADDDLFWTYSVSKLLTTVVIERLAERGELRLDAPIADAWPGFGAHGKQALTARDVLRHRTGMPLAGSSLGDALTMASWDRMTRRIERARPRLDPTHGPAYQWLVFGFVLGEWAARITGESWESLLRTELLERVPTHGLLPRLDGSSLARAVPVRSVVADRITPAYLNSARVRTALIPSAGVSATADGLAALGQVLLDDMVRGTGVLLTPSTLERMATPTDRGQRDQWGRIFTRWGEGVQLGSPRNDGSPSGLGDLTSARTIGHDGSGSAVVWLDPERELVVAVTTDLLTRSGTSWLTRVSDAVVQLAGAAD